MQKFTCIQQGNIQPSHTEPLLFPMKSDSNKNVYFPCTVLNFYSDLHQHKTEFKRVPFFKKYHFQMKIPHSLNNDSQLKIKILPIILKLFKMNYHTSKMSTKLINFYPYIISLFKTNDLLSTQEVRIRLLFTLIFFNEISLSFPLSMSPSSSILTSQFHLTNSSFKPQYKC